MPSCNKAKANSTNCGSDPTKKRKTLQAEVDEESQNTLKTDNSLSPDKSLSNCGAFITEGLLPLQVSSTTNEKRRVWNCPELSVFDETGPYFGVAPVEVDIRGEQEPERKGRDEVALPVTEKQMDYKSAINSLLAERSSILRDIKKRKQERFQIGLLRASIESSDDGEEKIMLQKQLKQFLTSILARSMARRGMETNQGN